MALGYVCIHCGWKESVHIYGWSALSEADRQQLAVLKPGFAETQIECSQSYEPSPEELSAIKRQEEVFGAHEGQH